MTLRASIAHPTLGSSCSSFIDSSVVFVSDSDNNLPLMYFSDEDYLLQKDMEEKAEIIMLASYGLLFLSALPCKIIGL